MFQNKTQDIQFRYETKSERVKKYIDLDSTYRNRVKDPLQSNFTVNFNKLGRISNLGNSSDVVSLSAPFATGISESSTTTTSIILQTGSSPINNFYINDFIGVAFTGQNEYRQVIAYSGASMIATVSLPYSGIPSGLNYTVRQQPPTFEGFFVTGSAIVTGTPMMNLLLSNANTNVAGNSLIRVTTGANINQIRPLYNMVFITGGVFSTIVLPSLPNPIVPVLDLYEILPFSYDNAQPLIYGGTTNVNQPVCYKCSLNSLSIPYVTLASSYGGFIVNYPYVYCQLASATSPSDEQPIYSNNPNSRGALFKVPIKTWQYEGISPNEFITFENIDMIQTIKFKPNDSLQFSVFTPDGQLIQFAQPDNFSPLPSNPLLQISALFEIERLD
jgi:hypothetical protein